MNIEVLDVLKRKIIIINDKVLFKYDLKLDYEFEGVKYFVYAKKTKDKIYGRINGHEVEEDILFFQKNRNIENLAKLKSLIKEKNFNREF